MRLMLETRTESILGSTPPVKGDHVPDWKWKQSFHPTCASTLLFIEMVGPILEPPSFGSPNGSSATGTISPDVVRLRTTREALSHSRPTRPCALWTRDSIAAPLMPVCPIVRCGLNSPLCVPSVGLTPRAAHRESLS